MARTAKGFEQGSGPRIRSADAKNDDSVDLAGDIGDLTFAELGYDSLALLETASRIEREYGVKLADDVFGDADTPTTFVGLVNERLSGVLV